MLISKSREEIIELAKEFGLEVTFDNPPDKIGFWVGNRKLTFEEVFIPILTGKIDIEEELI